MNTIKHIEYTCTSGHLDCEILGFFKIKRGCQLDSLINMYIVCFGSLK